MMNLKGVGVAFFLLAAVASWMCVAYPQLSAAATTSSTEYVTGMVYLGIGFISAALAIVTSIVHEKGKGRR
jgi:hypothetical protein